jgi:hypothetical protein
MTDEKMGERLSAGTDGMRQELLAKAQYFVDCKYVARADARQKSMGLAYVEAERQDLAREIVNFAVSCIGAPAQCAPNRDQIAKAIYAGWLDADFCTENHFQWFDAGKDNPDSCVHYSNVAKAFKVADRILALSSPGTITPPDWKQDQAETSRLAPELPATKRDGAAK